MPLFSNLVNSYLARGELAQFLFPLVFLPKLAKLVPMVDVTLPVQLIPVSKPLFEFPNDSRVV